MKQMPPAQKMLLFVLIIMIGSVVALSGHDASPAEDDLAIRAICAHFLKAWDDSHTNACLAWFVDDVSIRKRFLQHAEAQKLFEGSHWQSKLTQFEVERKEQEAEGSFRCRRIGSIPHPDRPPHMKVVIRDMEGSFEMMRIGEAWRIRRLEIKPTPWVLEEEVEERIREKRARLDDPMCAPEEAASIHASIAYQYMIVKRFEEAEKSARQAVEQKDSFIRQLLLGEILKARKEYRAAIEAFQKAKVWVKGNTAMLNKIEESIRKCEEEFVDP